MVLISPRGASFEFAISIGLGYTNNQAEYEAVHKGLQILEEARADAVEIFGGSLLVVKQLLGEYECKDRTLQMYLADCK